jgi:hypothetical protein
MGMDMTTLYGETAASFLLHGALVYAVATMLAQLLPGVSPVEPIFLLMFLVFIAFGSAIINGLFLLVLHQITCGGAKNPMAVLKGAGVSALISPVMAILPEYVEPLRLAISSMVFTHKYLGTPDRIAAEETLESAAAKMHELSKETGTLAPEVAAPLPSEGAGSLSAIEYALQTEREVRLASSYLTAFAGAYGMAIGAQWTNDCKA